MTLQSNRQLGVTQLDDITDQEYQLFTDLIYEKAGISIKAGKKSMICGRLNKRLRFYNVSNYSDYIKIFQSPESVKERQMVVDLLTTNETYFFREPKHFDYLKSTVLPRLKKTPKVRIWSAASSTGEEAYSLSMLLEDQLGSGRWEIFASDISSRVLEAAKLGVYRIGDRTNIPPQYLSRYCLKGVRSQQGCLLISEVLRKNMTFSMVNLNDRIPDNGMFDIIFLRNVLIYFDTETKKRVVKNISKYLKRDGCFIISHSETLNGIDTDFVSTVPSIYIKS